MENNSDLIFKYVPFSLNTLKLLIKGEIWLGMPLNLNDPFEGEFIIENANGTPDDEFIKRVYKYEWKFEEYDIKNKLKEIKEDPSVFTDDLEKTIKQNNQKAFGISCFSRINDSISMWSHYADSHKGICLAFNRNELLKSLERTSVGIKMSDINYSPNLPKVTINYEHENFMFDTDINIYLRKLCDWKKEEEVRIHNDFTYYNNPIYRSVPFDKSSLKQIILGHKIPKDDLNTIFYLIRNDKNYDIDWGFAKKDLKSRKMILEHRELVLFDVMK